VDDRQVIMVLYKKGLSVCYIGIYKKIQKCKLKLIYKKFLRSNYFL